MKNYLNLVLSVKSIHLRKGDKIENKKINETIGFPCFIKPNQSGSSFGVSKIYTEDEIENANRKCA